jgi:hypothetical protein
LKNLRLNTVTLIGVDCLDFERLSLAAEICREQIEFADVRLLTSLPAKGQYVVPIRPISSIEDYSRFILTELHAYINSTHALLIQHDGFVLHPGAWRAEFLEYDYIGAPWLLNSWALDSGFSADDLGKRMVGNGGFSLRSKRLLSLCAELARKSLFQAYHPEDMAICYWQRKLLEEAGIRFAPVEIAEQFSLEEQGTWTGQFGFHGLLGLEALPWDNPRIVAALKALASGQ